MKFYNRENEIDIIAVNDCAQKIKFYEAKRNENRINLNDLQLKSKEFLKNILIMRLNISSCH
jgi:hypothetical protein